MFKKLVIAAASVLSMTEALKLEALCCGEDNACCTNDCGCEEPADPPIIPDAEDVEIIIDDPEEPEPEIEVVPETPEPEEPEEEVPEVETPTPIDELDNLPESEKEEIEKEVCALPWDLP